MRIGLLTTKKAISAIVVAITMINEFTRTLKYKRKIVLVTNGTGPMSGDGLEEIQKKIVEDGIELVILWVISLYLFVLNHANVAQWC